MSQLVFSTHQNPKEVGSTATKGVNFPGRVRVNREKEEGREKIRRERQRGRHTHMETGRQRDRKSLPDLHRGCQQKVWPRLKVYIPVSKEPD